MKAEKAVSQARLCDQEYLAAIDRLAEIHANWETDMRTACNVNPS
jgi:hypothetical protein